MKILAVVILIGLTTGCSVVPQTTNLENSRTPYRVLLYDGGHIVIDHTLAPGSAQEQAVAEWLRTHSTGWKPDLDLNTYVPGRMVKGERFTLDFRGKFCVLNHETGKGHRVQLKRSTEGEEIPDVFH